MPPPQHTGPTTKMRGQGEPDGAISKVGSQRIRSAACNLNCFFHLLIGAWGGARRKVPLAFIGPVSSGSLVIILPWSDHVFS